MRTFYYLIKGHKWELKEEGKSFVWRNIGKNVYYADFPTRKTWINFEKRSIKNIFAGQIHLVRKIFLIELRHV